MSENESSNVINVLRFPMAAGVVFIHAPWANTLLRGITDGHILTNFFDNFFRMAVPLFFFISGYLFFKGFQDSWSWTLYIKKIKRRFKSLFIPYLLWNLVSIGAEIQNAIRAGIDIKSYLYNFSGIEELFSFFWATGYSDKQVNIFGYVWENIFPYHIVMWYIRDLMVITLLAPLVYSLIKHSPKIYLSSLTLLFVFGFWIILPGTSPMAFCFFSFGAYCSLYHIDFISISTRIVKFSLPLCVLFFSLGWIIAPTIREFINIYILFAIPTTIAVGTFAYRKGLLNWSSDLAPSSFFIYTYHLVPYLGSLAISQRLCSFLGKPNTESVTLVLYFVYVSLAIFLSVVIYRLLARYLPRTTAVFCGGRK